MSLFFTVCFILKMGATRYSCKNKHWEHCLTSSDCVTKESHLSPKHYELDTKQNVLDQTRVSVSGRYSKGNAANKLGVVTAQT